MIKRTNSLVGNSLEDEVRGRPGQRGDTADVAAVGDAQGQTLAQSVKFGRRCDVTFVQFRYDVNMRGGPASGECV